MRLAVSLLVVALATGAATGRARADGTERDRARKLMQEAADLLDRHDAKAALARVEEAYRLYPNPKTYFNFGVLYQELGMNVAAYEAYGRFLREARDASAAQKRNAEEALDGLKKTIAFLDVKTNVDAAVALDGRPAGRTQGGGPVSLRLNAGSYEVTAEKAGYLSCRESVLLAAGESRRLELVLAVAAAPPVGQADRLPSGPPPVSHDPGSPGAVTVRSRTAAPPRAHNLVGPGLAAAGVLALAAGAVVTVMSNHEFDDAKAAGCPGASMPSLCSTSADKVQRLNTTSYVLYGAGGLLAAIGLGVWIAAPYHHDDPAPLRGFSAGFRGTF
jgi:hypothetical protein